MSESDHIEKFRTLFQGLLKGYKFNVKGLYIVENGVHDWLPLPSESAVIGKVVEITIKDHIRKLTTGMRDLAIQPGGPRSYPDFSISGPGVGNRHYAVDVKCVRRSKNRLATHSAMGLATFDAIYFREPERKAANIMAPYGTYHAHLVLVALYDYEMATASNVELLVVEKWRIASRKRASGTRCYVAAVKEIDRIKKEQGEFSSEEEYNAFWRSIPVPEKNKRTKKPKEPKAPKTPKPKKP